jgi:hypothetical protein
MFRKNMSVPSSGSKNKRSKKPEETGGKLSFLRLTYSLGVKIEAV